VDWEKLRDQYLFAVYSEEPGRHRTLKKQRAPRRPRNIGRRQDWNMDAIEKEATKAIDEVRGVGSASQKETHVVDAKKEDNHRGIKDGLSEAQSAGTIPKQSHAESTKTPDAVDSESDSDSTQDADRDEFPIHSTTNKADTVMPGILKSGTSTVKKTTNVRQADDVAFNGKPIEDYTPSKGNCPGPGDVAANPIPCAPPDLSKICNKYDDAGSFKACFEACKPSFCCVHGKQPHEKVTF
jgi:hypothetical protein